MNTGSIKAVRNWVFLGDSLTEGVGSRRVSYVSELAAQLREAGDVNVHEFRLRHVDTPAFNRYLDFNVGGSMSVGAQKREADLWLWNLACEGKTTESDFEWLPLINSLRPELVVIFRGSLESIIRPAMLRDGKWPWWVPGRWRGYAAMDPRCYFSANRLRKAKQYLLDSLKQRARLRLLSLRPGKPLMDLQTLALHQSDLLRRLREVGARIVVAGLLPVDQERFPGSPEYFKSVNAKLKRIAQTEGAGFYDWGTVLPANQDLFYRDGFHPNAAGAGVLATMLRECLTEPSAVAPGQFSNKSALG